VASLAPRWRNRIQFNFETFAHDHQREPALAPNGKPWAT
jgi:hypothetical protein